MNATHTPGPWTANRMRRTPRDKDRRCGFVVNGPDLTEDFPTRICNLRVPSGITGFSEGTANARLIAAAPDLLAALESAKCPYWVHNAAITNNIEALRKICLWLADWNNNVRTSAIAKAKGE